MRNETKFAIDLARKVGVLLKEMRGHAMETAKGHNDIVTEADLAAQKLISSSIQAQFPTHGMLGEESASLGDRRNEEAEWQWVVDPLDATVNYSAGIPIFCTSIALTRNGETEVGVLYDPMLEELFHSEKGGGAFLNGERVHVADRPLRESVIGFSVSHYHEKALRVAKHIETVEPLVRRFRSFGSTAHEVCYVACGRLAAYYNVSSTAWDFAAAKLILEEAGGVCCDLEGRPWRQDSQSILSCNNAATRDALVAAFRKAEGKAK